MTTPAAAPAAQPDLLQEIWGDIQTEATKVWGEIKSDAITIGETAYADFKQVLKVGAPIAVAAVAAEIPKLISGQEKFSNATVNVSQTLQAQLGPVAIQDVWSLVQMAYNGILQAAGGVPTAAAATPPAA